MIEFIADLYKKRTLLLGDTLVFMLVTLYGFATHDGLENWPRMFSTFIPLTFSWFVLAPFFGLYNKTLIRRSNQLWRIIVAMIAVVPFAAWLRGLWLQSLIPPVFVLVLGGVSVIGMLLWRVFYLAMMNFWGLSNG